nr:transposase [Candidatus Chloroploca asiatica]
MTDHQWNGIKDLIPAAKRGGRPRSVDMRLIIKAILSVVSGIQWRMLPKNDPKWKTVDDYVRIWRNDGTWQCIQDNLPARVRQQAGRQKHPTADCLDSQSGKTTQIPGVCGHDKGKNVNERKRNIFVDTLGLLMVVIVTALFWHGWWNRVVKGRIEPQLRDNGYQHKQALTGSQQLDGNLAVVRNDHQQPSGQPLTDLDDHLTRPGGQLLVALPTLLVIAFRGCQDVQQGQRPDPLRSGNRGKQQHPQPAQTAGFSVVAGCTWLVPSWSLNPNQAYPAFCFLSTEWIKSN